MLISIIIPVYNKLEHITQCIRSVQIQPQVDQIILIDDGSTDGTYQVLVDYCKKHPIVELHTHKHHRNKGPGLSRNLGLSHADSKYIAFLDADDYYLENRFTSSLEYLINNTEVNAIYSTVQDVIQESFIGDYTPEKHGLREDIPPTSALEAIITNKYGTVQLNGFLFNREFLINQNIKCSPLYGGEDMNLIFEACIKGNVLLKATPPTTIRRIHNSNITHDLNLAFDNDIMSAKIWYENIFKYDMPARVNRYFFRRYLHFRPIFKTHKNIFIRLLIKGLIGFASLIRHPILINKLIG